VIQTPPPPLPPAARLLGFAGLLPQLGLVAAMLVRPDVGWRLLAFAYAALILSFLGGIWWGIAVRRGDRQAGLLVAAVVPSLVALALVVAAMLRLSLDWPLVALGSALMLTLPVDRHLVATGGAPRDWMRLRVPLSLGLGALTILAGAMG
jgi:hypothetical protein